MKTTINPTARHLATLAAESGSAQLWRGSLKASMRKTWAGAWQLSASYFRPYGHHHYREEVRELYDGDAPAERLAELASSLIPDPRQRVLMAEREQLYRDIQRAGDLIEPDTIRAIADAAGTPDAFELMAERDVIFWRGALESLGWLAPLEVADQGAHRQEAGRREPLAA